MTTSARAASLSSATPRTRSVVLVTATELEPRSFGKQVVLGGLLDHLCRRLGAERVHVVVVGRTDAERPEVPYVRHVIERPGARDQLRSAATRVVWPPHSSLQEAALWSGRVLTELERTLTSIDADLEIWDTMRMGQYARRLPRRRRVLYADDLFSLRYASMLERVRTDPSRLDNPLGEFGKVLPGPARRLAAHPWVYVPLLHLERRLTARSENASPAFFDATVLVSEAETVELTRRSGSSTVSTLLPLVPDAATANRHPRPGAPFVFLGGLDFPPNADGLTWFLGHCRDEVLAAVPDFTLLVVGRGSDRSMPVEAEAWGGRVRALGWVDDLDEVLTSSAALLSPLRIGSGTKIKVLEALARGLPVVATEHGVLGLGVDRADGCLVGASPAELASLIAEAADPETNGVLSAAAAQSWRRRFCPAVAAQAYDAVLGLADPAVEA